MERLQAIWVGDPKCGSELRHLPRPCHGAEVRPERAGGPALRPNCDHATRHSRGAAEACRGLWHLPLMVANGDPPVPYLLLILPTRCS
jgi:hypothetical protein